MKKKIFTIFIMMSVLLFSSFAVGYTKTETSNECNQKIVDTDVLDPYTHTVLAEQGTHSGCGHCPPVSGYMNTLYSSGSYDFEYVALVDDKNSDAADRVDELGLTGFPTVFFDGGYTKVVGNVGSTAPYIAALDSCGQREVADIDLSHNLIWEGNDEITVSVTIHNNAIPDTELIEGPTGWTKNPNPNFSWGVGGESANWHLHSYVTEITSRWNDADGHPYKHAMIGYAFNEDISVGGGMTYSDSTSFSYNSVSSDNIMVLTTIFDSYNLVVQTIASVPTFEEENPPSSFDDITYAYILNGYDSEWSEWTSDTSFTYTNLSNGEYTFKVKAKTIDGEDETPAETTFNVDTEPPETNITSGPTGTISVSNVAMEWDGSDVQTPHLLYSYKLEGFDNDWSNWAQSKGVTYNGLPDASYTFKVKARDEARNEDPTPAEISFTVQTGSPNEPPNTPSIDGPLSGKAETEYEYTFVTSDPDGDDVYYYIEWGDGETEEWVGPYSSGEQVIVKHTWGEEGDYSIRAKAKDLQGAESDWATLEISMPKNKAYLNPFLWFFERLMNHLPWLEQLLGLY